MEVNHTITKSPKQNEKSLKRLRPSFDDKHWVQFFEEAHNVAQESYQTIRSFEIFKSEYINLQLQQTAIDEVHTVALRRLKEMGISGPDSKGFKRMGCLPNKKLKLEDPKQNPSQGYVVEKKVFKPILINGTF